MGKWADFIVSRQLDDDLLKEVRTELEDPLPEDVIDALSRRYEHTSDLKELKKAVKWAKPRLRKDVARELSEAAKEIQQDLKYASTDRGKTTIAINDWLEPWYIAEIRKDAAFEDVMIGGNAEKNFSILVVGKVASQSDLERLRDLIAGHNPPFEVDFRVAIAAS